MANMPTDSTNTIGEYTFTDSHIICKYPISPRMAKTGKSMLLATTRGAESIPHDGVDVQFNVNIYVPIAQWDAMQAKGKAKK